MSAVPKIIEGTWDEVLQHAHELAGHRLRVTVIDAATVSNPPAREVSPEAARAWFDELTRWINSHPPLGPWDDSRESIYDEQLDHQL